MEHVEDVAEVASRRRLRITRRIILIVALLGAVRVFAFAAAYPPFLFIDEGLHFENVIKYTKVGLPDRADDRFDLNAARIIATYGVHGPGRGAGFSPAQRQQAIDELVARHAGYFNCETFTPPLYYTLAAGWYKLGQFIGLSERALVFWLRFLAVPLYAMTIWLAGRLCLKLHAGRSELAVGLGVILAALPQDIFYTINSDVASPLTATAALYLLATWLTTPRRASIPAAFAGLAVAAALLVKYTNAGVLAAVGAAILLRVYHRRARASEIAAMLLCAAIPVALWMIHCQLVLGDWTAVHHKADMLGWTPLTLVQSIHHPIFGPLGMMDFSSRLCITFWRGELIWGDTVQRIEAVDRIYIVITALGLLGTIAWLLRPSRQGRAERPLAILYIAAVVGSVLFLALASARFDYGRCFFPSRGFPYFAAGRLLTGMMTPFAILLVGGFAELLDFTGRRAAALVAALLIATLCLTSELYIACYQPTESVFASRENFYHLRSTGNLDVRR